MVYLLEVWRHELGNNGGLKKVRIQGEAGEGSR